ncbi:hypothetical protein D3C75_1055050 [compost metagenome]
MLEQISQQVKLSGRQVDKLALPLDLSGLQIGSQCIQLQQILPRRCLLSLPGADLRTDPGGQLHKFKGFGDIVIGPQIKPLHLILHRFPGCQDQYRCPGILRPDPLQHLKAALPRQLQIQ